MNYYKIQHQEVYDNIANIDLFDSKNGKKSRAVKNLKADHKFNQPKDM